MASECQLSLGTSVVPFESSIHGRERREQRDICKKDLQAAIRHGTKEPANNHETSSTPRWKYTFAGIVYVTDETSSIEITSYALPLPFFKVNISERCQQQYEEGKRRVKANPRSVTSLTVCIVDKSGSMKKSDVNGHTTRARAVYYAMGEEYLASIISKEGESQTDLVTVIEMRERPTVVVNREPKSWLLYNRLVELSEQRDERSHGFYRPALVTAFKHLKKMHNRCALSLIFLSDGRPSDWSKQSLHHIEQTVRTNSIVLRDRLAFATLGFGTDASDFSMLKEMTSISQTYGGQGNFVCGLDSSALKTLLSSSATSLEQIRSMHSRLATDCVPRELTFESDQKERFIPGLPFDPSKWKFFNGCQADQEGNIFTVTRKKLEFRKELRTDRSGFSRFTYVPCFVDAEFSSDRATGIAIRKKPFGQGAERVVYGMTEIDANNSPVGPNLVAKDSLYRLDKVTESGTTQSTGGDRKFEFHQGFLHTQQTASNLAKKFNNKLERLQLKSPLPQIRFLSCSVYFVKSQDDSTDECWLSEEMIDSDRYKKWNDNHGGVDGIPTVNPMPSEDPWSNKPDIVAEEDEEEASEKRNYWQQRFWMPISRRRSHTGHTSSRSARKWFATSRATLTVPVWAPRSFSPTPPSTSAMSNAEVMSTDAPTVERRDFTTSSRRIIATAHASSSACPAGRQCVFLPCWHHQAVTFCRRRGPGPAHERLRTLEGLVSPDSMEGEVSLGAITPPVEVKTVQCQRCRLPSGSSSGCLPTCKSHVCLCEHLVKRVFADLVSRRRALGASDLIQRTTHPSMPPTPLFSVTKRFKFRPH